MVGGFQKKRAKDTCQKIDQKILVKRQIVRRRLALKEETIDFYENEPEQGSIPNKTSGVL